MCKHVYMGYYNKALPILAHQTLSDTRSKYAMFHQRALGKVNKFAMQCLETVVVFRSYIYLPFFYGFFSKTYLTLYNNYYTCPLEIMIHD